MASEVVESARPLTESSLWTRLVDFYVDRGPDAWLGGHVPQHVSTNGQLADTYAAIAAAFLTDWYRAEREAAPLILEVGGGSGLLAWRFLSRLIRHHFRDEALPAFDYLLTDGAASNVRAWSEVPRLKGLVDDGILHLGRLRVGDQLEMLVSSKDRSALDWNGRPVILIANYILDSLPSELLRVRDGKLYQELVALESIDTPDEDEDSFDGVVARFESRELDEPLTDHPVVREVLEQYRGLEGDSCIPLPLPAISFLEELLESTGPFMMLAGDLAFTTPLFPSVQPIIVTEYVACYTNFHLLGEIFRRRGGTAQFADHADPMFSVGAFIGPPDGVDLELTRRTARLCLRDFTPFDAFSLREALSEDPEDLDFRAVCGWLRLARFDDETAELCLPHLRRMVDAGEPFNPITVAQCLMEVYRFELPEVSGEGSLEPRISYLLIKGKMYGGAAEILESAAAERGRSPERLYMWAVALNRLGRREEAAALLFEILDSVPGYWASMPDAPSGSSELVEWLLDADEDALHLDYVDLRASLAAFAQMDREQAS